MEPSSQNLVSRELRDFLARGAPFLAPGPRGIAGDVGIVAVIDGGWYAVTVDEKAVGKDGPDGGDRKRSDRDVGHALRTAYVETVNEEVPSELLDLLGKLD